MNQKVQRQQTHDTYCTHSKIDRPNPKESSRFRQFLLFPLTLSLLFRRTISLGIWNAKILILIYLFNNWGCKQPLSVPEKISSYVEKYVVCFGPSLAKIHGYAAYAFVRECSKMSCLQGRLNFEGNPPSFYSGTSWLAYKTIPILSMRGHLQ